jgi:hypothetical protein
MWGIERMKFCEKWGNEYLYFIATCLAVSQVKMMRDSKYEGKEFILKINWPGLVEEIKVWTDRRPRH